MDLEISYKLKEDKLVLIKKEPFVKSRVWRRRRRNSNRRFVVRMRELRITKQCSEE